MKLYHALSVAVLLVVAPVEAANYLITYEGTVSTGTDTVGVFGAPGALDGRAFTAVFTLTAPLAGASSYDDGTVASIGGGSVLGRPSPVSATLTMGGATWAFIGDFYSYAEQFNEFFDQDRLHHYARRFDGGTNGNDDGLELFISSLSNNIVDTTDYTTPLSYAVQQGDTALGKFQIQDRIGTPETIVPYAEGNLTPTRVTIAAFRAVPEPAAWATMVLGFGLVGGTIRRRQKVSVRFA